MKKNTMKMACNTAMRNSLGHKPTMPISDKPKGKVKVMLTMAIVILVVGVAVVFALA
jgi:hypothetical protein